MQRHALSFVTFSLLVCGCAPETDLTSVPAGGDGTPGGAGGVGSAGAVLVDPVAGAIDVPLNLAAVVVRFPASVTWGPEGLRVCDASVMPDLPRANTHLTTVAIAERLTSKMLG